jgi:large subunit ribosomal protein L29
MKADKIRQVDTTELQTQLSGMKEQMFRIRFSMSMGQADGMKKYRELRKDRARILTILRQRELEAGKKG